MLYSLYVQYKRGKELRVKTNLTPLQLRLELAERLVDNEKEESVVAWTIYSEE